MQTPVNLAAAATSTPILEERAACPGCGHDTAGVLLRERYDSAPIDSFLRQQYEGRARLGQLSGCFYELVRCERCELAYQRTVPGPGLLGELYDEWIPSSERERLARLRDVYVPDYWAQQIHFIIEHLGLKPCDVTMLDFGMGWAEWASMARAYGCEVYGSELSVERIRYAHSIGIPTLDWAQIGQRAFHYINTEQVFEHLLEPLQVLRHLAGALAPRGVIKISVPDSRTALRTVSRKRSFEALSASQRIPVQPLEHVNCFEYRTLARLAAAAGLKPLRPRIRLIYNASSGWLSIRRAARLLARPVYRHVYPKSTFTYFVRDS
jgi:Methyltransferase domain